MTALPTRTAGGSGGFSLLELLLALVIGCGLFGVLLQVLLAEGANSKRLGRLLRERAVAQRSLELVRGDLLQARGLADSASLAPACNLAGRSVVLHLDTAAGPITYSIGKPAEPIWRGRVLMRCGPAYGLHGELGSGAAQNRVVLDALASSDGFRAQSTDAGVMRLELQQAWADGARLHSQLTSQLPVAPADPIQEDLHRPEPESVAIWWVPLIGRNCPLKTLTAGGSNRDEFNCKLHGEVCLPGSRGALHGSVSTGGGTV